MEGKDCEKKCKKHRVSSSEEVVDEKKCLIDESVLNVKHIKELHVYTVHKTIHTYQTRVFYHCKKSYEKKIKLETEVIHLKCDDKSDKCEDNKTWDDDERSCNRKQ